MNLHRASSQPDWAAVPAERRNAWQRLAARTAGSVTPGNIVSIIGFLSVPLALYIIAAQGWYVGGAVLLAAGRACDLIDGWLAQLTGTKSPLGEKLDASLDKLSVVIILGGSAALGLLPWWAIGLLLLPHLIIAVLAVYAWRRGSVLHPSASGKYTMAAGWLSLLAFIAAHAFPLGIRVLLQAGAVLLLSASLGLGAAAIAGYLRTLRPR